MATQRSGNRNGVWPPPAGNRIAATAARQGGVMTAAQLLACGLSRAAIHRRVQAGRLVVLGRGVYRVGPILTEDGERRAALWTGGQGTALSFVSACELLHCGSRDRHAHHITVPRGRNLKVRAGLVVHHVRGGLRRQDIVRVDAFPVTSPARTALDLACVSSDREFERLVETMLHERLLTERTFTHLAARHPGHPGLARLLALTPGRAVTESCLEDRVRTRILDGLPLPEPEPQFEIIGRSGREYRADFAYVEARVLIEADSRRHHERAAAFESDRARDADLAGVGWQTLRFTHVQTRETAPQCAENVLATVTGRLAS